MKFEINIDPDEFIQALVLAANDLQSIAARKTMRDIRKQVIKALVAEDEPKTETEKIKDTTTLTGDLRDLRDILTYIETHFEEDRLVIMTIRRDLVHIPYGESSVKIKVSPEWMFWKLTSAWAFIQEAGDAVIGKEITISLTKFINQCKEQSSFEWVNSTDLEGEKNAV